MSARLSIAAVCTYQALLVALIFLKPEIDPSRQPISEYALGRLARQDRLPAAVRRALLWSAGVPLVGLVVFFVILATVVPAEGWPLRFLLVTYMVWLITLALQVIKLQSAEVSA